MSYRVLTPRVQIWLSLLIAADVVLFFVALRATGLQSGTAPLLDLWDLVKAAAIAVLLLMASRRVGSTGLAVFGVAFLAIGVLDATRAHALIARRLFDLIPLEAYLGIGPATARGVSELLVMLAFGVGMLAIAFAIPGGWEPFPQVRLRLIVFLSGLLFFAGFVDLVGNLSGDGRWAIVEEAGERLMFSIALAYSALVFTIARQTPDALYEPAHSID